MDVKNLVEYRLSNKMSSIETERDPLPFRWGPKTASLKTASLRPFAKLLIKFTNEFKSQNNELICVQLNK